MLDAHGVQIEEYAVEPEIIGRLDESALTAADLEAIDGAKPICPRRWYDYQLERGRDAIDNGTLWQNFPLVIPFAVIDSQSKTSQFHFGRGLMTSC